MSHRYRQILSLVALCGFATLTLVACGGGDASSDAQADASQAEPAAEADAGPIEVTVSAENLEAVRTILTAADAADGTTDGVVHRCPGCSLAMDGSADHAMNVADHELHFCSSACRKRFSADAEASLVALEVPAD